MFESGIEGDETGFGNSGNVLEDTLSGLHSHEELSKFAKIERAREGSREELVDQFHLLRSYQFEGSFLLLSVLAWPLLCLFCESFKSVRREFGLSEGKQNC